jgi:hypothetical protein
MSTSDLFLGDLVFYKYKFPPDIALQTKMVYETVQLRNKNERMCPSRLPVNNSINLVVIKATVPCQMEIQWK